MTLEVPMDESMTIDAQVAHTATDHAPVEELLGEELLVEEISIDGMCGVY